MDVVTAPTTVSLSPQPGALPAALQPGAVINALVMQLLDRGQVRLALANTLIDVMSQVPLVPGTTVRLAVEGTPSDLKLVVLPGQSGAGGARPADAAVRSAPATVDGDMQVGEVRHPIAVESSQTPLNGKTPASLTALSQAVRSAAARQSGLAPLLSNVAAATEGEALPAPVRQAATELLALRVPLRSDLTAGDIKQAFARSGLLFEARLAASSGAPPTEAAPAEAAPDLKAALSIFRHVLRAWLETTPGGTKPTAAPSLNQAALPLPDKAVMPPAAGAPQASAAPAQPGPPSAPSQAAQPSTPAAPGHPVALSILPEVLGELAPQRIVLARDAAASGPPALDTLVDAAARPRVPAPLTGPAPLLVVMPRTAQLANPTEQAGEARGPTPPAAPDAHTAPPPPYRGAPPAPQPAVAPALVLPADPRAVGETLLTETDAALARQTLLQAASLPDRADPQAQRPEGTGPRWNFEIPFATPQGTAIAQFEIARDGHAAPAEAARVWRVRFTLDVEPMGPVHAHIALAGPRATVSLWAERGTSAARLREQVALLRDALKAAEFEPGDVVVREGTPPHARAAAGRFLDRAS